MPDKKQQKVPKQYHFRSPKNLNMEYVPCYYIWYITVTSLGKNPANYSWTVTSTGDQWTVLPSKNLCKASVSSITVSILVAPVYKLHEHERTDPPRRAGAAGVACALNSHHPDAQLSYKLLNKLLSSPERVRYQYLLWIINIYNNEK